jgi:hypothetical protein
MANKPIEIKKTEIEHHRKLWTKIAKKTGWYQEPFYIQVWVNMKGKITNSVSFRDIKQDWICNDESENILTKKQFQIT